MKVIFSIRYITTVLVCFVNTITAVGQSVDPLPSWNEGSAKEAVKDFVAKITTPGSVDFVSEPERIAVFDNDGTLWAEQPLYFQFLFAIERIKLLAPQHPEWKDKEPFASILKGNIKSALSGGEHSLMLIVGSSVSGLTTEQYDKEVKNWLSSARHPKTKRLYTEMVYQPMLELLTYYRANGFKTFIVSGGGIEFMRAFAERIYGIPPEQVIGSSGKLKFELQDGRPVLIKLPELDFFDDKEGKPIAIQKFIGRRPISAFGNSDGDLQMLQWTAGRTGPYFCLYVHHTDEVREFAYDRTSSVGRLDKGLDEAKNKGWTVVDMKKDWKIIFPPTKQ